MKMVIFPVDTGPLLEHVFKIGEGHVKTQRHAIKPVESYILTTALPCFLFDGNKMARYESTFSTGSNYQHGDLLDV